MALYIFIFILFLTFVNINLVYFDVITLNNTILQFWLKLMGHPNEYK